MAFSTPNPAAAPTGSGAATAASPAATPGKVDLAHPNASDPEVFRIAGPDRYATAAEVALEFPGETGVVIVASGEVFADALTGQVPTAAALTAAGIKLPQDDGAGLPIPILLTRAGELPGATAAALDQMNPGLIIIVGGEKSVSADVEAELQTYADTERYAGDDRYETSALVAQEYGSGIDVVYMASGATYPDALAGGARAGRDDAPMLLTATGELLPVTADALTTLDPDKVVVFGGPSSVSDDTLAAIKAIVPDTTRIAGVNRYDTAAIIAGGYEKDTVALMASGQKYPDALTASALAGYYRLPLLLSRQASVPAETKWALDYLSPQAIGIIGGPMSIGTKVEEWLNTALPAWADSLHVQLLSFNDYHGHLETEGGKLTPAQDPAQNLVGGVVNLTTTLKMLRTHSFDDQTLTVAAGDLIGGSTFLSGLFHDEPSVESLEAAGLDISSVGNHEFDEGTTELLRIQNGGCHPVDGCYFPNDPYDGADYQYLAANVVDKTTRQPLLPATEVRTIDGVKVGFIGMTLQATPTLVSPGGVATVDFLDEVETANAQAAALQDQGVESIVVLLHEGGYQTGGYNECLGISDPIKTIAEQLDPAIDQVITGHTHQPYICSIDDPAGNPRMVTSANQYGRVVTETDLVISRSTHDVIRDKVASENHLVLESVPDDPEAAAVIAKWKALSSELAGRVVGSVTADITGDSSTCRCAETDMGNFMADAILWGTDGADEGGAQIAFMNVGGIRASLLVDQISNGEQPGEITYQEAYNVAPFGNLLVTVDMTGAQIDTVLEEQYQPVEARGSRPMLSLGVSEGFTYTWDATQPQGQRASDLKLNGVAIDPAATYRVGTINFLQEGGDLFNGFKAGTNLKGGPEDLANLAAYLTANSPMSPPGTDRVSGL